MYYLFINKQKDIERYRMEFDRVSESISRGITPVYSEVRSAKTMLVESFPYNMLNGIFLVAAALVLSVIPMNELVKIAVVIVINSVFGAVANFIFTHVKHMLRIRLCRRMGIEPTEKAIAVMESLEYQSV